MKSYGITWLVAVIVLLMGDFVQAERLREQWYAMPLWRYQNINAIVVEEAQNGLIEIQSSGVNEYNAVSVLNWDWMLNQTGGITLEAHSVCPAGESGSRAQAGVGIILSENMAPSSQPVRTGHFIAFAWDALRNRLIVDESAPSGVTRLLETGRDTVGPPVLAIKRSGKRIEFYADEICYGAWEWNAEGLRAGIYAYAQEWEGTITVRQPALSGTVPASAVKTLKPGLEKLVIANLIPWHSLRSFAGQGVSRLGADVPIMYPSGNSDEDLARVFWQMVDNGIDCVLVDIAQVKWWQQQVPIFKRMLKLVEEREIPLRFIYQLDSSAHTHPTVENVMPGVELLLEGDGLASPVLLRDEGKIVFFTFDTDSMSASEWKEIIGRIDAIAPSEWVAEVNMYNRQWRDAFAGLELSNPVKSHELTDYLSEFMGVYSFATHPPIHEYENMVESWRRVWGGEDKVIVGTVYNGYYNPGKTRESNPRNGTQTYRDTWEINLRDGFPWIVITTWNEYNENHLIEPTLNNGGVFLDITRYYIGLLKNDEALLNNPNPALYLSFKPEVQPGEALSFELLNLPGPGEEMDITVDIYNEGEELVEQRAYELDAKAFFADSFEVQAPSSGYLRPVVTVNGQRYEALGASAVVPDLTTALTRHVNIMDSEGIGYFEADIDETEEGYRLSLEAMMDKGRVRSLYLYRNGQLVSMPSFAGVESGPLELELKDDHISLAPEIGKADVVVDYTIPADSPMAATGAYYYGVLVTEDGEVAFTLPAWVSGR